MNDNEAVITAFYTHFQRLDWQGMVSCYSEDIVFYDPVFGNLEGASVRAMWEMLLTSAKDLRVEFAGVHVDEDGYGGCNWTARYTFSRTGRPVVNEVKAHLRIINGKIAEHMDEFNLWKWSRQALGLPGLLFGWTPVMKKKIGTMAKRNLQKFMAKN